MTENSSDTNVDWILDTVCRSADALLAAAEPHAGLLPSLMDRSTGRMLAHLPALPPSWRAHLRFAE
jgi:hypothetical protein